jgi:Spy/CpxP family protein refolding chaperone
MWSVFGMRCLHWAGARVSDEFNLRNTTMKMLISLTTVSLLMTGMMVQAGSACCKAAPVAKAEAKVEAAAKAACEKKAACDKKVACDKKTTCGKKARGCPMKAALGKLDLTDAQQAQIKAIAGEGECKGKGRKERMKKIKSVLTEEQLKKLEKHCAASKGGKTCKRAAAE